MAWENLLDASFRGAGFEVRAVHDQLAWAVVEHAYPYRRGAPLEGLGRGSRRISLVAVFNGPDYLAALEQFMAALDEDGAGELIHPVFGSMQARPVHADVPHEAEQPDHAEVAVEFWEDGEDVPLFASASALTNAQAKADSTQDAAEAARDKAGTALAALLRSAAQTLSAPDRATLTNNLGDVLDPYDNVVSASGSVVQSGVDYLDYPEAYGPDLWSTMQGAASQLLSVGDPAIAAWGRLANLFTPETVKADTSTTLAQAGTGAAVHESVLQASTLASHAADILEADAASPAMTPAEVETVVGQTRQGLQTAMDNARSTMEPRYAYPVVESLRDASLNVQELGAAVITQRPPLVARTVQTPSNLHLLAFRLYGNFRRAEELGRLNPQVRNPNDLQPGQELSAYAT